jgi:aspartate kinase
MKVLKFGGTSVQFAKDMRQVGDIIAKYSGEKILVVLSACRGATDNLIKLSEAAAKNDMRLREEIINSLCKSHFELIDQLFVGEEYKSKAYSEISALFAELKNIIEGIALLKELTLKTKSAVVAFGELLSTTIFTIYAQSIGMDAEFLDSRTIMRIERKNNCDTAVDFEATLANLNLKAKPILESGKIPICQGFIGSDFEGRTAVLSRGGSDYSAAVFGALLDADEIQIWTDVSGVLSADPRIASNAETIRFLTFEEAAELSFFGAKVLHPDTVKPAVEKNIPVRVLNTRIPDDEGSLIRSEPHSDRAYLSGATKLSGLCRTVLQNSNDSGADSALEIGKIYYKEEYNSKTSLLFESAEKSGDYSLICIAGANLDHSGAAKALANLFEILSDYPIESISISRYKILIVLKSENVDPLFLELHDYIIKLNK